LPLTRTLSTIGYVWVTPHASPHVAPKMFAMTSLAGTRVVVAPKTTRTVRSTKTVAAFGFGKKDAPKKTAPKKAAPKKVRWPNSGNRAILA